MSKSIKIKGKAPKARSATALPAMMRNSAGPMRDRRERRDNEPTDWLDELDDDETPILLDETQRADPEVFSAMVDMVRSGSL